MRLRPCTSIVMIALLLSTAIASSQTEFGVGIGYEFGTPLGINRTPGAINTRNGFNGLGTSSDHTFWIGSDLTWPSLLASQLGLRLSLGAGLSMGNFTSQMFEDGGTVIDPGSGNLVPSRRRFSIDIVEGLLRMGVGAPLLFDRVSIEPGLWSTLRFVHSASYIEEPGDSISVIDGAPLVAEEDLLSDSFRYGVGLGGSVSLPLSRGMMLRPSLSLRVDLPAALRDAQGIRSLSAGAAVALVFDGRLNTPVPSPEPPPVVVTEPPPPAVAPLLTASVRLYGNADGRRDTAAVSVRAEDVLHRLRMPLLPVIFFDDSTTLPSRYSRLISADASRFSVASLAGEEPAEIHYSTLDVIGWRMGREPGATLTIAGMDAAGEAKGNGMKRARSVAAYLHNVWGIEERRMKMVERNERSTAGRGRQVQIASSDADITAPIATQWIARNLVAPSIGATPVIRAEAGVRHWTLTIMQNGERLARYDNNDTGEGIGRGVVLPVPAAGSTPSPLVATLVVRDSAGREAIATDTLPILWEQTTTQEAIRGGRERIRVLFAGSEGDAPARAANRLLFQSLAAHVRSGARVVITPLAVQQGRQQRSDAPDSVALVARDLLAELRARGIRLSELHIEADPSASAEGLSGVTDEIVVLAGAEVIVEQDVDTAGVRNDR